MSVAGAGRRGPAPPPPRIGDMNAGLLLALLLTAVPVQEPVPEAEPAEVPPRPEAPPLDGGEWLNVDGGLTLDDLRGHVVVIDFWTYCCINCLHMMPVLERLEDRFADDPVLVVGVHANKFPQEAEAENIRAAIARHGIRHPVVVDDQQQIWKAYRVRAWPTFVVLDTEGKVYGQQSGEIPYEVLEGVVAELLKEGKRAGTLAEERIQLADHGQVDGPIAFPGKVLAHGGKLYVADTGNHRIVEIDPADGSVLRSFGSGTAGLVDGEAGEARFRRPQGLAVLGGLLYVADTENHALRSIELAEGKVATLAGDGNRGRPRAGVAADSLLASPWALEVDGERLHIAMAGSHQLWTYSPKSGALALLAGSGRENVVDGPAVDAALAQPSGFVLVDRRLWFADSETSAVRFVDLDDGRVGTLVGKGLFVFGDVDGERAKVRLQHPLGIDIHDGQLIVADTFNNKIKRLDPETGAAATLFGGEPGASTDQPLVLWEPGGLCVAGDTLYVADTNHHRILAFDLTSGDWRVVIGPASDD